MPRIEPSRLLKCLNPLLSTNGSIKSDREVDKIYGLMTKYNRKLVSKCIYLNILTATPPELLDLFMARGGWDMISSWLQDTLLIKDFPVLNELLNLLLITPVNVDRLKQNDVAKIIKNLSRVGGPTSQVPPTTQALSRQIFDKWLNLMKGNSATIGVAGVGSGAVNSSQADLSLEEVVGSVEDLTSLDLNDLQFNPEVFNSTIETLPDDEQQMDTSATTTTTPTSAATMVDGNSLVVIQDQSGIGSDILAQPVNEQYALISRDGKNFLVRVDHISQQPTLIEAVSSTTGTNPPAQETAKDQASASSGQEVSTSGRKRPRKDPTIKKVPGGKPPLRTYSNLSGYNEISGTKKGSSAASQQTASLQHKQNTEHAKHLSTAGAAAAGLNNANATSSTPETATRKSSLKVPPPASGVDSKTKSSPSKKSASSSSAINEKSSSSSKKPLSSNLSQLQKSLEEQRLLKLKVKEQKRVAEERRKKQEQEQALKAQRERDEETLKSLNLVPLGKPQIPKIPRKQSTFADAIGIPGSSGDKKGLSERKELKKQSSVEEKKGGAAAAKEKDAPSVLERRRVTSTPKVKVTSKTRGLSLIEDMTRPSSTTATAGAGAGSDGVKTRGAAAAAASVATGISATSQANETKSKSADKGKSSSAPESNSTEGKSPKSDKSPKSTPPAPIVAESSSSSPSKIGRKKRTSSETSITTSELNEAKRLKLFDEPASQLMDVDEDMPSAAALVTPSSASSAPGARKVIGLQESSLFMDALNANNSANSLRDRKLRRRTSSSIESSTELPSPKVTNSSRSTRNNVETPPPTAKPIFNFYRETLKDEEQDDEEDEAAAAADRTDELNNSTGGGDSPSTTPKAGTPALELKSILHLHRSSSSANNSTTGSPDKKAKSVKWVDDASLKTYFYFEMDEDERVNVTRLTNPDGTEEPTPANIAPQPIVKHNFTEMKKLEKAEERKLNRRNLFGVQDRMEEKMEWVTPRKIIFPEDKTEIVCTSREKDIQEAREASELQAFYFSKRDIPDCPDETLAVVDSFDMTPPTPIPLDDIPGVTKVITVTLDPVNPGGGGGQQQAELLHQQQLAQALMMEQQSMLLNNMMGGGGGGGGGEGASSGSGFDSSQLQQYNMNLWSAALAASASGGGGASGGANPFAAAMSAAAAAVGLDQWGTGMTQQQQILLAQQMVNSQQGQGQGPPSLMDSNFMNPFSNQYDDYNQNKPRPRGGMHGHGGGGRRGDGERRQFSRFDHRGGGGGGGGRGGGGRGDFDERFPGGGGEHRGRRGDTRMAGGGRNDYHRGGGRGGGGGGGGRSDMRGGGPPEDRPPRERGKVGRTVLCKFFAQGICKAGASCDFLHPGINGPMRGGRFHNNNANANEYQSTRGGGGGGQRVPPPSQNTTDTQDTSPASPDPIPDVQVEDDQQFQQQILSPDPEPVDS